MAAVALMDSSIAATAINGGYLTPATEIEYNNRIKPFSYDDSVYESEYMTDMKSRRQCRIAIDLILQIGLKCKDSKDTFL